MIETMRERITMQKSKAVTDKDGNHVLVWEDYYSCAAYANNLSGKEYWAAAQVNAQTDLYFLIFHRLLLYFFRISSNVNIMKS